MFHLSTVEKEIYSLLKTIFSVEEIHKNFALAGGTSLALQLGHRTSIDLDIFSYNPFDTLKTEREISAQPGLNFQLTDRTRSMLFAFINNVKCDFIHEPSRQIQPFIQHDGINYFHIEDIAAMKLHTVCGRGKRKDFFDIYVLAENFGWKNMLKWFEMKYDSSQFYFLLRSIHYFNDADEDAVINGIAPYTKNWEEIKEYIRTNCV
ncbi:MAG: nucleotidyl transferase AbiEii/AbiGii toxin family protein [Bacteroidia bacterium]